MTYFESYSYSGKVNGIHFDRDTALRFHNSILQVKERKVPEDFEMFTARGNRRVADLAQIFTVNLINKVKPEEALTTFLKKFVKLYNTKTMAEAGDTAVREAVYSYVNRFTFMFDWGQEQVDRIWEGIV